MCHAVRDFVDPYTSACCDLQAGDARGGMLVTTVAAVAARVAAGSGPPGFAPTPAFAEMLLAALAGGQLPALEEMASWEWLSPHDAADASVAAWVYFAALGSPALQQREAARVLLVDGACPFCRAAGCGCAPVGSFAQLERSVGAMMH